jgi:hypothetical protein
VANLKVKLRAGAQISRQFYRGERWYVVRDPAGNQYHRLSDPAYRFVGLLNGQRTVGEASTWTPATRTPGLAGWSGWPGAKTTKRRRYGFTLPDASCVVLALAMLAAIVSRRVRCANNPLAPMSNASNIPSAPLNVTGHWSLAGPSTPEAGRE